MPRQMKKATYPGTVKRGGSWSYYLNINGKKVWGSGYPTQKAASEARTQAASARDTNTYVLRDSITLAEYVQEAWLPSVATSVLSGDLKPTTGKQYRQKIAYAVELLGSKQMQKVTAEDVEKFKGRLLKRGLSPRTVTMAMRALSMMMKHAIEVGEVISRNPCQNVKKPKVDHRIDGDLRVMNPQQLRAVLAAAEGTQWYAFLRLAFFTGMRRGELLAVKWSDIDWEAKQLTIRANLVETDEGLVEQTPKGGSRRVIDLDDDTVAVLRTHRATQNAKRLELGEYWQGEKEYVTTRPDGAVATPAAATAAWQRASDKADCGEYRLHDCRHTHATILLEAGVPLHVVAHRLGHKDPMVTASIYAHVINHQAADAAAVFAAAVNQ